MSQTGSKELWCRVCDHINDIQPLDGKPPDCGHPITTHGQEVEECTLCGAIKFNNSQAWINP